MALSLIHIFEVLSDAGLVRRDKTGRTVRVRLTPEPLKAATDWLSRYERFWSPRLDRLAEIAEAREASLTEAPKSEPDQ